MPSPATGDVIVGFATAYTAPANTAMPADTVAAGAAWPVGWTYIGGTEEGVSLLHGSSTQDIRIEEQSTPVFTLVNEKNIRVQFTLSEDTVNSMKLAYGGGTITTTAAASGQIGKKRLVLSDTLDSRAVGLEAVNSQGFWRRVYIPQVLSVADVTTAYRRANNNRAYNVELRAVCPASSVRVDDQTALALP